MDMQIYFWTLLTLSIGSQAMNLDVRLAGGLLDYEGRVEVYHNGQWGSICDDKWSHVNCMVVCRQLTYGGGKMLHDADAFGTCTGPIHLDDVMCDGNEHNLGECHMSNFGENNCDHKEDVGCMCDQNPNPVGSCQPSQHRIHSINDELPWVGRAEVSDDGTNWGAICDDDWDDYDAYVFCKCLGQYSNTSHYRSYWSQELGVLPSITMAYDSVKCNEVDKLSMKSIWECESNKGSSKCPSSKEAAGVACGPIPHKPKPSAPTVNITCSTGNLEVCFKSTQYAMSANYFSLNPTCLQAIASNVTDGVCYEIDMTKCTPLDVISDTSHKHYCYDISYSQFDTNADTLITDAIWSRKACCSQAKNGTASASFEANYATPAVPVAVGPTDVPHGAAVATNTLVDFTMDCFTDDTFSAKITPSTQLMRGEEVYCKITSGVWDSSLYLIVPFCQFYGHSSKSPAFTFLMNKCPTTDVLGLSYYNFEKHSWGFKFLAPKFQDYENLYVSCDAYMCDPSLDAKPYCDRSCDNIQSARKRRSVSRRSVVDSSLHHPLSHVTQGPFPIEDNGFGPMLVTRASAVMVQSPIIETTDENSQSYSAEKDSDTEKTIVQKDSSINTDSMGESFTKHTEESNTTLVKIRQPMPPADRKPVSSNSSLVWPSLLNMFVTLLSSIVMPFIIHD